MMSGSRPSARGRRTSRCARARFGPRPSRRGCPAPGRAPGPAPSSPRARDRRLCPGSARPRRRRRRARRVRAGGPDIAEGDAVGARQQGAEALAEVVPAVERQCPVGQAVVGVVAVEDAGAVRRLAGELDGRLDRLGARIAEEDTLDALVRTVDEASARTPGRRAQSIWTRFGRSASMASWSAFLITGWLRPRAKTPKPESRSR